MKKVNKKGNLFGDMGGIATSVAAIAFVIVITFLVLGKTETQMETATGNDCNTTNSADLGCNATNTMRGDVASIVGWVSLIVIVMIGILVLGLVKLIKQ